MDFSSSEISDLKNAVMEFFKNRSDKPIAAFKKDFELHIAKAELELKTSPDKRCQPIFTKQSYLQVAFEFIVKRPDFIHYWAIREIDGCYWIQQQGRGAKTFRFAK